jgi:hypothetical protein
MGLNVSVRINDTQHSVVLNVTLAYSYAECHYTDCHTMFYALGSVQCQLIMLIVVLLNVIVLSVVSPNQHFKNKLLFLTNCQDYFSFITV